jgi:hypothetical protein
VYAESKRQSTRRLPGDSPTINTLPPNYLIGKYLGAMD